MNTQIKKINLNHSFIFFLFCNIFSVIVFKFSNLNISNLFCLLLILTIGVSHGALDHLKGKKLLTILNIVTVSPKLKSNGVIIINKPLNNESIEINFGLLFIKNWVSSLPKWNEAIPKKTIKVIAGTIVHINITERAINI